MNWEILGYSALAITIVSQLVIWWFDRKDPTKLKWLRRLKSIFPMRESERRWLADYERQRRDAARHGLSGKVVPGTPPTPLDTRVGGPLIVPKGAEVPTNELGQALLPLLLIRLSDLPDTEGNVFPPNGLVQVLVEASSFWDVQMPAGQGSSFRIICYPDGTEFDVHQIDEALAREHPAWAGSKQNPELFQSGQRIEFEPVLDIAPASYYGLSLTDTFGTKDYDDAYNTLYYALEDEMVKGDVMIGGHAVFTQDDIRSENQWVGFENLIRLSSYGGVFSWVDAGEASIMVPDHDLGSGRMENAVFYFDFH